MIALPSLAIALIVVLPQRASPRIPHAWTRGQACLVPRPVTFARLGRPEAALRAPKHAGRGLCRRFVFSGMAASRMPDCVLIMPAVRSAAKS